MDSSSILSTVTFLQSQGYLIMFILMIIEGPVITAAAAFASSLNIFNIYSVFILSVLGNIFGDLIYFFIGKISRKVIIDRYFKRFGIKEQAVKKIESSLKNNPGKALAIIKIIPPLPTPGLILAGAVNMSFEKFVFFSFIISFFYSLFFTLIGFYMGRVFNTIIQYSKYAELLVIIIIIIFIVMWFLYNKFSKKLYKKVEKMSLK